ncbi:DUF6631 family protein [Candidatus Dactylopiibacterium carminicum]|nr:DUF6631 family protein [Candidatus Dactylopiibacterium carminicum]
MAPKPAARRSRKAAAPADDLAVLFPDREITVAGVQLTVRELTFEEQVAHHAVLADLADALGAIPPDALQTESGVNVVLDVLAAHWEGVRGLVAISTGQPLDWIRALGGEDGENLALTWWAVNQGFFMRRLLRPALMRRVLQVGAGSSQPSSSTATAARTSAATPHAS